MSDQPKAPREFYKCGGLCVPKEYFENGCPENWDHLIEFGAYQALEKQNEVLTKALQFYAQRKHYDMRPGLGAIIGDTGGVAREALLNASGDNKKGDET